MGANSNQCNFNILYNEICQHLEGLCNSVNQSSPNKQCMKLPDHAQIRDSLKVQDYMKSSLIWFQITYCN